MRWQTVELGACARARLHPPPHGRNMPLRVEISQLEKGALNSTRHESQRRILEICNNSTSCFFIQRVIYQAAVQACIDAKMLLKATSLSSLRPSLCRVGRNRRRDLTRIVRRRCHRDTRRRRRRRVGCHSVNQQVMVSLPCFDNLGTVTPE